nr:hypothetical protein Iba_chr06aCG1220 [Ipomoea batatas]
METAHHRHDSKLHGAIVAVEALFLSAGEVVRLPFLQHVLEPFSAALSRLGQLLPFAHVALLPRPQGLSCTESVVNKEGAVLDRPVDVVNAELPVGGAADGDFVGSVGGVGVSEGAVGFVKAVGAGGFPVSPVTEVGPARHGNGRHGRENCGEQEKSLGSSCHVF